MCTILFWLGSDNIDCYLQLSSLDALEKVAYFGAIVHSTVTIICKAFNVGILFLVECALTIIVRDLQLSFCFCGLPGHMVGAKKMLVDVEEHSLTIMHTLHLFHVDVCIHVHTSSQEFDTPRHCQS